MSEPKTVKQAAEATIDSVGTAIGMLWNWLGAPPKAPIQKVEPEPEAAPSILEFLPKSTPPKPDGRIPAVVVDTEGEDA